MFKVSQLRELIIKPALLDLVMYSEDAVELLIFTCAVESNGGTYIKQIKGPALGIYQMEPDTYNDIWQNYLKKRPNILQILIYNFGITHMPPEDRLIYDLRFATVMSRIYYWRFKQALPSKDSVDELWNYYKQHYNTYLGAATKTASIEKYHRFLKS